MHTAQTAPVDNRQSSEEEVSIILICKKWKNLVVFILVWSLFWLFILFFQINFDDYRKNKSYIIEDVPKGILILKRLSNFYKLLDVNILKLYSSVLICKSILIILDF